MYVIYSQAVFYRILKLNYILLEHHIIHREMHVQWKVTETECGGAQLLIIQEQGDNTPTILNFPYDMTGVTFEGTIALPVPISLSIGSGITIDDIISCTGSILNNILTISAITSGVIYIGMPISQNGIIAGTFISAFGAGTGGTGTYIINQPQTFAGLIVTTKVSMQLTSEQTQTAQEGQYSFDLWTISPDIDPIRAPVLTGFYEINNALTMIT